MPDKITDQNIGNPFSVLVSFGRNLFDIILNSHGKSGWNAYIESMQFYYKTKVNSDEWPPYMPIHICICFHKENFFKYNLSNLDFSTVYMRRCYFEEADLSGCKMGSINFSSFKNANLSGAIFTGNISGADFEGANLEKVCFKNASFSVLDRPLNLPNKFLELCEKTNFHESSNGMDDKYMYKPENEPIYKPEIALYPEYIELKY